MDGDDDGGYDDGGGDSDDGADQQDDDPDQYDDEQEEVEDDAEEADGGDSGDGNDGGDDGDGGDNGDDGDGDDGEESSFDADPIVDEDVFGSAEDYPNAGEEDFFLVPEVVIEVPFLHVEGGGDLFDGRAVIPEPPKSPGGTFEDVDPGRGVGVDIACTDGAAFARPKRTSWGGSGG